MSTAFGLSKYTNWFGRIAPVFKIGKGAADEPPGWGAIIDIVLKIPLVTMEHYYTTITNSMQVLTSSWHKSNIAQAYGVDCYGLQAEDGEPYIVDEADLPENKVHQINAAGNVTKLKRFEPNKGIKMLGLHKAATLQENTEFMYIQTKAE
eukprot:12696146-Ditylum_brightwellii.AAC.1